MWNFWGMPILRLAPSRSIWTCFQLKECYFLVNVKLFRSSSGHRAPTDNNPPSSRKQPSWTRWLPACWQHNIRLYKRKWKSTQLHVFLISTASSLLHYRPREFNPLKTINHRRSKHVWLLYCTVKQFPLPWSWKDASLQSSCSSPSSAHQGCIETEPDRSRWPRFRIKIWIPKRYYKVNRCQHLFSDIYGTTSWCVMVCWRVKSSKLLQQWRCLSMQADAAQLAGWLMDV